MRVATGLAQGRTPDPDLAGQAVREAMAAADLEHPQAVLLYLTSEFAQDPKPAIAAAARAAGCLQVTGCTTAGVFTEKDWVLDAPAAAAMVFGDGLNLHAHHAEVETPGSEIFTLSAPNALDLHWLVAGGPRFGAISGDATGQGPYSVWTGGRIQPGNRVEMALQGADISVGVSQGIRPLSNPATVDSIQGHDLCVVGGETALVSLLRGLPLEVKSPSHVPTHLLMAGITYGEREHALEEGRYHLLPVVGINGEEQSVTVAAELSPGLDMFWALRQPQAAEHDMNTLVDRLTVSPQPSPAFALMFPCIGRGPWFYGGEDRDIQTLTRRFPGLPVIGFYGNGEIAHTDGANRLLQYSVVLALGHEVTGHV